MSSDLRAHAETRLTDAATALALTDPRPPLRERLRDLRDRQPDAFERAIRHYEVEVLPALLAEEPLEVWIRYAGFLGGLTAEGRLLHVDTSGRARAEPPALAPRTLVLFVPADTAAEVLVAAAPEDPSAAQQATLDLLVHRKLALP